MDLLFVGMSAWLMLAFWEHTPHPFLIQFSENVGIRYYGLAYLGGFFGAGLWLNWYHRRGRSPLDLTAISDLMTYLIVGVLVGGRLGYFLLYHPQELISHPLAFFRVWEGGMASHGGFVGVVLAVWWYCRRRQVAVFRISDLIVTVVPLGLFLGRLANFANGELWGKSATVPWAVIFARSGGGDAPRHPSQLYEALLEGLVLLIYLQLRFWRSPVAVRQPGRLSGEFLVGYAAARIICELFREPDATLFFGLSRGTFYSLFLALGGAILIARVGRATSQDKI